MTSKKEKFESDLKKLKEESLDYFNKSFEDQAEKDFEELFGKDSEDDELDVTDVEQKEGNDIMNTQDQKLQEYKKKEKDIDSNSDGDKSQDYMSLADEVKDDGFLDYQQDLLRKSIAFVAYGDEWWDDVSNLPYELTEQDDLKALYEAWSTKIKDADSIKDAAMYCWGSYQGVVTAFSDSASKYLDDKDWAKQKTQELLNLWEDDVFWNTAL